MSYRRRLSLSIVALILVLVAAVSFVYLRHLVGMQLRFALQQAEIVAEQVRSAALEAASQHWEEESGYDLPALRDDPMLAGVLSRSLGGAPTLAEIALTNQDSVVLLTSAGVAGRRWAPRPSLRELSEAGFLAQWRAINTPERDYEVTRALAAEGKAVLVVHVAVTSTLLRRELEPPVRRLAWSVLLSLAASLVLAAVFSHLAFRPLDRLGEAIDRMTKGELAPPVPEPAGKSDEYTAISSKLNLLGQQFRDAREGMTSLRGNMEQLMQQLEGAVMLFDQSDRLIIASAAVETLLGRGRWQMMGQALEEIFPAGSELGALVSSAARLRQPVSNRVVELAAPGDGPAGENPPPARVSLSVEVIDDFTTRRRLGTLVILRDAETRRRIASQVEVSSRLAAISRLTGGVAHEIKNPLQAITLHLELLRTRLAGAESRPPPELEVIGREMARLDRVVKTFLDFNRPVDLKLTELPLEALVSEVASLAAPEAARQKVRVELSNHTEGVLVQGDRDLLKQALLNLTLNGIQAMPEGGDLQLSVSRLGPEAQVSIADHGVGIPPEQHQKIFRLYYTTKKGGSGIGLAMTFRIVQLHNGTIEFSSEVGKGTTFRLRFPVLESR